MRILLFVALHIALVTGAVVMASAQNPEDEAAVRATVKRILDTWNAHDAEANTAFDDDTYESWDGTVKGPEGDLELLRELFEANEDIQRNMTEEIGVQFVTPNVAIYKFRGRYTGGIRDGNPLPPADFLHAMVMVKREGDWRLAASLNAPQTE